jgi:hypothetical protein
MIPAQHAGLFISPLYYSAVIKIRKPLKRNRQFSDRLDIRDKAQTEKAVRQEKSYGFFDCCVFCPDLRSSA